MNMIKQIQSVVYWAMHVQNLRGVSQLMMLILIGSLVCTACQDEETWVPDGQYRREALQHLPGFAEEKADLLSCCGMDNATFISLSTSPSWELLPEQRQALKQVRDGVSKPDTNTLLQKVISLADLHIYMDNVYGGTVGGFVCEAADVKQLATMYEVYWGMRLDYEGSVFREDGAGYAVIRFCSNQVDHLLIPYVEELGGTQPHQWPNGGGGFTTSPLGEGGYPEWLFDGYYAPREGAEIYEVTPQGREMLRAVYREGRWQTFESPLYPVPATTKSSIDLLSLAR